MSLVTLAELKSYLGIVSSSEDTILSQVIAAAQDFIEKYTDRYFEPRNEVRRYRWYSPLEIALDQDLLVLNNLYLESTGNPPVSNTDIQLWPFNTESKSVIQLIRMYFPTKMPAEWLVDGVWGFSSAVPPVIKQACLRLSAYMYRQKDAQIFDVTAMPEIGQMVIPQGIPKDVAVILQPFRRLW